jgi:WD40 repeat protein
MKSIRRLLTIIFTLLLVLIVFVSSTDAANVGGVSSFRLKFPDLNSRYTFLSNKYLASFITKYDDICHNCVNEVVRIHDAKNGSLISSLEVLDHESYYLSPNLDYLTVTVNYTSDLTIVQNNLPFHAFRVYSFPELKLIHEVDLNENFNEVDYTPDGKLLMIGYQDEENRTRLKITLYDPLTDKMSQLESFDIPFTSQFHGGVKDVQLTPGGEDYVITVMSGVFVKMKGQQKVLFLKGMMGNFQYFGKTKEYVLNPRYNDQLMSVYNTDFKKLRSLQNDQKDWVLFNDTQITTDQNFIIAVHADTYLRKWDIRSGKLVSKLKLENKQVIFRKYHVPDQIVFSTMKEFVIWDLKKWEKVRSIPLLTKQYGDIRQMSEDYIYYQKRISNTEIQITARAY